MKDTLPVIPRHESYWDSSDIQTAIKILRDHKAAHVMGFDCECNETYEDDDFVYRYSTLEEQAQDLKNSLDRIKTQIDEIVEHRCNHQTDDTDSYYLRCGVCGSDGNA